MTSEIVLFEVFPDGEGEADDDEPLEERSLYYLKEEEIPSQKYKLRRKYFKSLSSIEEEESDSDDEEGKSADLDFFMIPCTTVNFLHRLSGDGNALSYCFIGGGKFRKPEYSSDNKLLIEYDMVPVLQCANNTFVFVFRKYVPKLVDYVQEMTHTVLKTCDDYLKKRDLMPPFSAADTSKSNAANNMILFTILELVTPIGNLKDPPFSAVPWLKMGGPKPRVAQNGGSGPHKK